MLPRRQRKHTAGTRPRVQRLTWGLLLVVKMALVL